MNSYTCISYVPLLHGSAGELLDPDSVQSLMDNIQHNGSIQVCMYAEYDGVVYPVFVTHMADQIYNHMMHWSDNKPTEWFTLYFYEFDNHYSVILCPNVDKSVKRYQCALKQSHNIDVDESVITCLYRPLIFVSKNKDTYLKYKNTFKDNIKLGFMDVKYMDNMGENINIDSYVRWVEFRVGSSVDNKEMLQSLVDQVIKDR